jgi:hypothetical protein
VKFKTKRIEDEYAELDVHNPELKGLLVMLDTYSRAKFSKEIVLTHLFRTEQEQIDLYKATEVSKRPAKSPHQTWEAVDLRSKTFTKEEQNDMCKMLNETFTNPRGKTTAFVHTIAGGAEHFHIQVLKS